MSLRLTTIWTVLLTTMMLGGCATGAWNWSDPAGTGAGETVLVSDPNSATLVPAEVATVSMRPGDAAATGNPEKQTGFIVEDQSPRPRAYSLDTGDRLRVFVYGQPNPDYAPDLGKSLAVVVQVARFT